jgi:hypothetical protein
MRGVCARVELGGHSASHRVFHDKDQKIATRLADTPLLFEVKHFPFLRVHHLDHREILPKLRIPF